MAIPLVEWPTSLHARVRQHPFIACIIVSSLVHALLLFSKVQQVALAPHRNSIVLDAVLQPITRLDSVSTSARQLVATESTASSSTSTSIPEQHVKVAEPSVESVRHVSKRNPKTAIDQSIPAVDANSEPTSTGLSTQPQPEESSPPLTHSVASDSVTNEMPNSAADSERSPDTQSSQPLTDLLSQGEQSIPESVFEGAASDLEAHRAAEVIAPAHIETRDLTTNDRLASETAPNEPATTLADGDDSPVKIDANDQQLIQSLAIEGSIYPEALSIFLAALPQQSVINGIESVALSQSNVRNSDGGGSHTDLTNHPSDTTEAQTDSAAEIATADMPQAALISPVSSPLERLAMLPKTVQIVFAADKNAHHMGSAEMRLTWHRYRELYSVSTESISNLSVENSGDRRVESSGQITASGLRPQIFVEERMINGRRFDRIEFDYVANTVRYTSNKSTTAAVMGESSSRSTADMMTLLFQFVVDAPTSGAIADTLPSRQAIERLGYEIVGNESMTIGDLNLETVHLRPRGAKNARNVEVWLASGNHHLPVKLRITELGRVTELVAINLHVEQDAR